jgi:hypothetical protein
MQGTLSACLDLTIGCIKFLFPKEFITIFGLALLLLPLANNTLPINQEFDKALGPIIPKRI